LTVPQKVQFLRCCISKSLRRKAARLTPLRFARLVIELFAEPSGFGLTAFLKRGARVFLPFSLVLPSRRGPEIPFETEDDPYASIR
jgi:hypothetical protein